MNTTNTVEKTAPYLKAWCSVSNIPSGIAGQSGGSRNADSPPDWSVSHNGTSIQNLQLL